MSSARPISPRGWIITGIVWCLFLWLSMSYLINSRYCHLFRFQYPFVICAFPVYYCWVITQYWVYRKQPFESSDSGTIRVLTTVWMGIGIVGTVVEFVFMVQYRATALLLFVLCLYLMTRNVIFCYGWMRNHKREIPELIVNSCAIIAICITGFVAYVRERSHDRLVKNLYLLDMVVMEIAVNGVLENGEKSMPFLVDAVTKPYFEPLSKNWYGLASNRVAFCLRNIGGPKAASSLRSLCDELDDKHDVNSLRLWKAIPFGLTHKWWAP